MVSHRRIAVLVCTLGGLGALSASSGGCKPDGGFPDGLSQVEEGFGNLRFLSECRYASPTSAFGTVGLAKQVPMPFQSWMWRGSQMEADEQSAPADTAGGITFVPGYGPGADIPSISLLPRSRLCAEYSATIHNTHQVLPGMKVPTRMQEVVLYARDPQEFYTSLMNSDYGTFAPYVDPQSDLASTNDEWLNNFYGGPSATECGQQGDNLPDALGMPYPLNPNGQAQFTHPLAPEDFLGIASRSFEPHADNLSVGSLAPHPSLRLAA